MERCVVQAETVTAISEQLVKVAIAHGKLLAGVIVANIFRLARLASIGFVLPDFGVAPPQHFSMRAKRTATTPEYTLIDDTKLPHDLSSALTSFIHDLRGSYISRATVLLFVS